MMRPARSRVQHGMPSCTRYGCKREECMEARRRASRRNYHAAKTEGPARVSSEEAFQYGHKLMRAGVSALDIAERSGVSPTQVRRLLRGELPGMLRETSDAILGVPMPDEGKPGREDGLVDATGARRRLQALAVQGFSTTVLSVESGVMRLTISDIRAGTQKRIRLSTLRVVVALHEKLWDVDPLDLGVKLSAVSRTKKHAEREGWLPTEAWSDIDDPDCKPALGAPRYVVLTEDAQELMEKQGYTRKAAAERLGVKTDTLNAAMAYYAKAKAVS